LRVVGRDGRDANTRAADDVAAVVPRSVVVGRVRTVRGCMDAGGSGYGSGCGLRCGEREQAGEEQSEMAAREGHGRLIGRHRQIC
jgi:hypothetical protein